MVGYIGKRRRKEMKKIGIIAAVCSVIVGIQSIAPLAAQHGNIWTNAFQLAQNETDAIIMNQTSLELESGEEAQLQVQYRSGEAVEEGISEWYSDDSNIAVVGDDGVVTAKEEGTAIITARVGGNTAVCEVTVKTGLEGIRLMPTELELEEGENAALSVVCTPSDVAYIPEIIWSSDNEDVVEVDDRGNLTAKKQGKATITVQVGSFTKTSEITVKGEEIPLNAIQLADPKIILVQGESMELELTYDPENTTIQKEVAWTSSDAEIVSVNNHGEITGLATGTAVITAEVDGKKDTCEVTVEEEQISLESIQLSKNKIELNKGEKDTLTVTYEPEDTTDNKDVTWTSSNEKVAVVQDGEIEAIAFGQAVITAKVSGKEATCEVTVKEEGVELEAISFEEEELNLKEGEEVTLEVIYEPEDTTVEKAVIWTSSDESVVSVKDGIVKAIGIGEAVVTAEVEEKQAYCDVIVQKKPVADVKLQYEIYDSENGWLDTVGEGETAGTEAFAMKAVRIRLEENTIGGGIRYSSYVQDIGWQGYVANGVMAGTIGKDQRIEAIKIKLTGAIASKYDIYYRSHVDGEGWLGWAKNGEPSGSEGLEKEMQAIQIVLIEKGQKGPSE